VKSRGRHFSQAKMGGSSSKRDLAGEASRVGHPYRKVSPRNLAYWLGSSRLFVTENPPAYSPSPSGPCAQPRASAPPATREESSSQPEAKWPQAPAPPVAPPTTPDEALRAIAQRTRQVPHATWNYRSTWTGEQNLLYEQAKVLFTCDEGTYDVKPESWADVIQLWTWLTLGKHTKDAARLLANFGLEHNESFMLQLAKPVDSSR
jgi:hypothetical protein